MNTRLGFEIHLARVGFACLAVLVFLSAAARSAQAISSVVTQPFQFTVTPPTEDLPPLIYYDLGYSDRATEALANDGVENALGLQAPLPWGFRATGRIAFGEDHNETEVAWDAELLRTLIGDADSRTAFHAALGGGVRHEWEGTYVGIVRVLAGKQFDGWNLFSNLTLERPFASDRDELDIITTVAWAWQAGRRASLGMEFIGEDWEGLWESEEAEGGAKLIIGPTASIALFDKILLTLIAGPIVHLTTSDPPDSSQSSDGDVGVIARLSIGYTF